METSILLILFLIAVCIGINGFLGMCSKVRHEYFLKLGLLCFISGLCLVFFDVVLLVYDDSRFPILATFYLLAAYSNTLAAQFQRISVLLGFEPANLHYIAKEWQTIRANGDYHSFLTSMKNSEYLRFISDALRIVHSIAVSLPRDYTFQVTDYGYLVDAFSLVDSSRYKILVAFPNIEKDKFKDLSLTVNSDDKEEIYVVSDKFGIKVPELLDSLSNLILNEKYDNLTINCN